MAFINGKPWKQQYEFNTAQTTSMSTWTDGNSLAVSVYASQAIVTKDTVYLLGGRTGPLDADIVDTIQKASIDSGGTLGTWSTDGVLPSVLAESQLIVTEGKLYLLGGDNGATSDVVYSATINTDGSISGWIIETSLMAPLRGSQAVVTQDKVYLIGGYNSLDQTTANTYVAPIDANGDIGTWSLGTSLFTDVAFAQVFKTNDKLYLLGGEQYVSATAQEPVNTAYTADIATDGTVGAWSVAEDPDAVYVCSGGAGVVVNTKFFMFGSDYSWAPWTDRASQNYTTDADIDGAGAIATWWYGNNTPYAFGLAQVVITSSKVYVLGGTIDYGRVATDMSISAAFAGGLNDYTGYTNDANSASASIAPPLVTIHAEAETDNVASCSIAPALISITSKASSDNIAIGKISPKVLKMYSVAAADIIASGRIRPKAIRIAGYTGETVKISPKLPSIQSVADTHTVASGSIKPKLVKMISSVEVDDIIIDPDGDNIASVNYSPKLPTISGFSLAINNASVNLILKQPTMNSLASTDIICRSSIKPELPKISSMAAINMDSEVIRYSTSCEM